MPDQKNTAKARNPVTVKPGGPASQKAGKALKKGKGLPGESKLPWGLLAIVLVYTALLYSGSLHNAFLAWDEHTYIIANKDIRSLDFSHIKAMFTNFYVGNWHPLTMLTYAFEYAIVGVKSPFLYHFDNLLLHLLNIGLLYWLAFLLSRNTLVAVLTALLFAIHPLRVESVTWLAERKDVLYSAFFLSAMLAYHFYMERRKPWLYLLVLLFFMLSGLSKSAAAVLPLVLLLMDYLSSRTFNLRLILEKLPLLLVALVIGLVALSSQKAAVYDIPASSPLERLLMVNTSFLRYLFLSVIPVNLSVLHPYPTVNGGALPFIYKISPFITLAILAGVIYSLRYTRLLMFALLFYGITIAMVLQFVPVGTAIIAERYMYITHTGLFFVLATFAVKFWQKGGTGGPMARNMILVPVALLIVFFSLQTFNRTQVWKSNLSLWTDVIDSYPNTAYVAYYNRGKAWYDAGNDIKAIADYDKAISIKPRYSEALINRGLLRTKTGMVSEGISDYNLAIAIDPRNYLGYYNRGISYRRTNDLQAAMADFQKAVGLAPTRAETWVGLGTTKISTGDFKGAVSDLEKARELDPKMPKAYAGLGVARFKAGDKDGACEAWKIGAELGDPKCRENYNSQCK